MSPESLTLAAPDQDQLSLVQRCPWCEQKLDGTVLASFREGVLTSITQTKLIYGHEYCWSHSAAGCRVPSLDRLPPARPQNGEAP